MKNKNEATKTSLVKFDEEALRKDAKVGISNVDPLDIRPPTILLMQKSSTLTDFIDIDGKNPKTGDYFHNGKSAILQAFECYFLWASKSKYISKIKPEEGEKDQYRAIGVMADDSTPFGMTFRSSALYAMSGLFTATISKSRPMYSFRIKVETKKLQNEKGEWFVPVLRVIPEEADYARLQKLSELAKQLETKSEILINDEIEDNTGTEKIADKVFDKNEQKTESDNISF